MSVRHSPLLFLLILLAATALACTPSRRGRGGGGGGGDDDDSAPGDDDDAVEDDDDVVGDDDDVADDDDDVADDDDDVVVDDDDGSAGWYAGTSSGAITITAMGLDMPCAGAIEFSWDGEWAAGTMDCTDTLYGMACTTSFEVTEGTTEVALDCMGTPGGGELELDVGTSGQIAVSVSATTESEYGEVSIEFGGAATEQ